MYIYVCADVTPVQSQLHTHSACGCVCLCAGSCVPLHVIVYLHNHVSVHVCVPMDECLQSVIAQAHGRAHEDIGNKKMSPNDQKEEQQKARHGNRVV